MKKLFMAVMLVCLALPAFSQDTPPTGDEYAKFQGVWYGAISDECIFFIFMNDAFTMIRQDSEMIGFISGKYSIFESKINLDTNKCMVGENGFYLPYEDGIQNQQMQYIISNETLVLYENEDTIICLKKIE
jgi:hypothetical protein